MKVFWIEVYQNLQITRITFIGLLDNYYEKNIF